MSTMYKTNNIMDKYSRNRPNNDGELDDNQVMMHLDKGNIMD
jgi:hypothetical protein